VDCRICSLAIGIALTGCATAGRDIKVRTVINPKADLAAYRTYAWVGSRTDVHDPKGRWTRPPFDLDAEARHLIDSELRARGLSFAAKQPDALVFFLLIADTDKQAAAMRRRYGPQADISGLAEAALVVGLVDAKTNKPVWIGAARAPAYPGRSNAQWSKARLSVAITALFRPWKPAAPP